MLKRIFRKLFGSSQARSTPPTPNGDTADRICVPDALNQHAPLRQTMANEESLGITIICREAVLDRQQQVAGYQFLLKNEAHSRIRTPGRRMLHWLAEILLDHLIRLDLDKLLGSRQAFVEIPDSFLTNPKVTQLPPRNTVIILKPSDDPGAPSSEELSSQIHVLRASGYKIGIPNPLTVTAYFHIAEDIDLLTVQGADIDIEKGMALMRYIQKQLPNCGLLVKDLPGNEDFNFSYKIGATLFQGGFITQRERWKEHNLGPNFARVSMLLERIGMDVDTANLVSVLKEDAAITLRLLRYVNSAANGLAGHIDSIEHAITILGRGPLRRWLALLLCQSDRNQPRNAAVLEAALVRARTMELIGWAKPVTERESLFLTGLLSLIDVILRQPIEHALAPLALDPKISEAILNDSGPFAPILALARACESMSVPSILEAARNCNADPEQVSLWYMDALAWTLTLQKDSGA